ncbi:MAG: hypothetical protein AAF702_22385 [Chloroflexota bacterium]
MRFLTSSSLFAIALWFFLGWSKKQTEERLDRIQKAAFNTPGVESPLPASVIMVGLGGVGVHFLLAKRLFGLKTFQSIVSVVVGVMVGTVLFIFSRMT